MRYPSFLEEPRQILIHAPYTFPNLYQHALLQLELVPILHCSILPPMHVANEVPGNIVHHDPLVERMEAEEAILPTLGFAPKVMTV